MSTKTEETLSTTKPVREVNTFTDLKLEGKYLPFLFKDEKGDHYVKSKGVLNESIILEFKDNLSGSFAIDSTLGFLKNPGIIIVDGETGISVLYISDPKKQNKETAKTTRVGCMTKRSND